MKNKLPIYKEIFIPIINNVGVDLLDKFNNQNVLVEYFESHKHKHNHNGFSFHYVWHMINSLDEGIVIHYPNTFFKDETTQTDKHKTSSTRYYIIIK